ncbi:MAG: class I SAM-dependent methyltransferase [Proteobacteria bacterium]|nr:class I SAM-dependent methyltransferase [Pseudomonadota bacterium]
MTQNIYDNAEFFAGYSALLRSREGLAGAPEWPALRAMLPDLAGRKVVDLGCGFGWFCRFAREAGATSVLGLDVSKNMLARARETTADPAIAYRRADLETLDLPAAAFELVYSSLVLHYIVALPALLAAVHRTLVPGGRFVFSIEHPINTAPGDPKWVGDTWPIDRYFDEGPRTTDWLAKGVVKQHRTLATYFNALVATGFTVLRLEEWGPTDAQIAAHPEWAHERQRPPFLLVSAAR